MNVKETVKQARDGDIRAFERLVEYCQPAAFAQAFSILGDSHSGDDAVQEAFIRMFRKLETLRSPEAFVSWFRRILTSVCREMQDRKRKERKMIEAAALTVDTADGSADRADREQAVHTAIQLLPDSLRMTAAFYYIGGMKQEEIADFLDIRIGTVKKRHFDAREKLKEMIMNMAESISQNKPAPEQVSARVIAELVSRAQPLRIQGHPLKEIVETIQALLPDYKMIHEPEIEKKEIYPSIEQEFYRSYNGGYQLDNETMLRTHTTGATMRAIKGQTPPARYLTAGRVYRCEREDERHLKVFHQLDGVCVSQTASERELNETIELILNSILNVTEYRYEQADYGWIDRGMDVSVLCRGSWFEVAGCGILKSEMLGDAGYNTGKVSGYAFGFGLERLAMLRLGLEDIRDLWRAPYLTL